ncbi:MAG: hypothetical protein QOD39_4570 [Mycobacterium sp.]|nr:hypothetical protein [Mycobacterium sp.]
MSVRPRLTAAGSFVAALSLAAGVIAAPVADAAGPRTIELKVARDVHIVGSDTVAAGFATFRISTEHREHSIQMLKLRGDYTLRQARSDLDRAFQGKLRAIKRVDTKILWLGGATATPEHDGLFAETLYSGTYILLDVEGAGLTRLHVTDASVGAGAHAVEATVTATTGAKRDNVFRTDPASLPRKGWMLFRNRAAEPHFMLLQQVARSTTRKDIRNFIDSGAQGDPKWIRDGFTQTGTISPDTQIYVHLHLPAGRYLLTCFWPSISEGMPHFFMGMYKLVDLK